VIEGLLLFIAEIFSPFTNWVERRAGKRGKKRRGKPFNKFVGKTGKVVKELRLAGMIECDGERLAARSIAGYLELGTIVRILRLEGFEYLVEDASNKVPPWTP
jgi:membrane-bound ClpP family serine protease